MTAIRLSSHYGGIPLLFFTVFTRLCFSHEVLNVNRAYSNATNRRGDLPSPNPMLTRVAPSGASLTTAV
jgi:hypothetical protein